MSSKILVPLDGSLLAEKAIPFAIQLAEKRQAELLLLRTTKLDTLITHTPDHQLEVIKQSESYLDGVKKNIIETSPNLSVVPLVVYAEPVKEIPEIASSEKAEYIVMTTHGRSGFSRMVMGSNASKIVQHSIVPVFVICPKQAKEIETEEVSATTSLNGPLVVSLDGTKASETVLDPAIKLSKQLGLAIHLLTVYNNYVPADYTGLGMTYLYHLPEDEQALRKESQEYLSTMEAQVKAAGVECSSFYREGNPAAEIVKYAYEAKASLIAMTTHARHTPGRFLLGSVADEVVKDSNLPVMLVNLRLYNKVTEAQNVFEKALI